MTHLRFNVIFDIDFTELILPFNLALLDASNVSCTGSAPFAYQNYHSIDRILNKKECNFEHD